MLGEDGRLADQDAGDEGAEHGMNADRVRDQRHGPHNKKDGRDHGKFTDEIVVDPADDEEYGAPADGEAGNHEGERADDAGGQRAGLDRAMQGKAEDDRNDDPADTVIDDGRGKDDLTDGSAHEMHFTHDHRHDLDRGDRQSGAEEQRGDQSLAG